MSAPSQPEPFLVFQPLHIDPSTLHQQLSQVLVTALADPQQIGLATRAVLPGHQADRGGKVATASVLLAIAHFHSQQAGGDRPDTRHAQQTTAQIIVGQLASQLFIQRLDLLIQIDEVIVQALQQHRQRTGNSCSAKTLAKRFMIASPWAG
jgi:hypothetical protein